eukprot:7117641-Pyramimonas_sp.AAC.1
MPRPWVHAGNSRHYGHDPPSVCFSCGLSLYSHSTGSQTSAAVSGGPGGPQHDPGCTRGAAEATGPGPSTGAR